jgi:hypothetical protein
MSASGEIPPSTHIRHIRSIRCTYPTYIIVLSKASLTIIHSMSLDNCKLAWYKSLNRVINLPSMKFKARYSMIEMSSFKSWLLRGHHRDSFPTVHVPSETMWAYNHVCNKILTTASSWNMWWSFRWQFPILQTPKWSIAFLRTRLISTASIETGHEYSRSPEVMMVLNVPFYVPGKGYNTYYLPASTATTISSVYAPNALRYPEVIIPGRVLNKQGGGEKDPPECWK